jgi:rod shape-determining protein MreD
LQEKSINIYVAGFLVFLTALLQTHFLPAFLPKISQFVPDLTLLLVIVWSLLLPWQKSLWLAFACGLILDLLQVSIYPLGLNALLFSLVAFGLSFIGQNRFRNNLVQAVPLTVLGAFGYRILLLLALRVLGYNDLQLSTIFSVVLPVTIIDGALMFVFFVPIRGLSRIGTE